MAAFIVFDEFYSSFVVLTSKLVVLVVVVGSVGSVSSNSSINNCLV